MPKTNLKKLKIAVLTGGRSGERNVSLRSGKRVFDSLKKQGFNVVQIDPDEELISKLKKHKIDVAYIALHGKYGEDGVVQGLLELANIPYTGSKVLASALAMNKVAAKKIFKASKIPTPKFIGISLNADLEKEAERIKKIFPLPFVLKPVSEGSSLGVSIIKRKEGFEKILKETVEKFGDSFVEEFVKGREVTVGILNERPLPILELVPRAEFYSFDAKYSEGGTEFVLPARLSPPLYKKTQDIALAAHKALGCRGVSRVDIIVSNKDHTPYVCEINTIPGMTDKSDLPAQAAYAGISFDELVLRILESAFI